MKNSKRIICIHGYGKRRGRQFSLIEEAFSDRYEILCPDYYELDRKDASYELWLHNVQTFLDQYNDEPMILIGFSLGALIACHFHHPTVTVLVFEVLTSAPHIVVSVLVF